MRITWNELTICPDGVDFDALLSEWWWLLDDLYRPFIISAMGDLFLCHQDGPVFWLDTGTGVLTEVAAEAAEFKELMQEPANAARWFMPQLVGDLLSSGLYLDTQQCCGYKIPLVLGGEIVPDNFEPTDIQVHFALLGQIHRQVKDLPPGTPIRDIRIE